MKRLVWLISYPKSGNTWFRFFLANLMGNKDGPLDINLLGRVIPNAAARSSFDDELGVDSHDLSDEECDRLRPDYYRFVARNADTPVFFKLHDALSVTETGEPLIPPEATLCGVYLIRNPLDVVVSYANHSGISFDTTIDLMNSEKGGLSWEPGRSHIQLRQRLFSWSTHVKSWTETAKGFKIHVMRYEDMKKDPESSFDRAVRFIGIKPSRERFLKSLEYSGFDEMKKQEAMGGFSEKPIQCGAFFHTGEAGRWKQVLTSQQVRQVTERHGEMMTRFGYLVDGEPV